MKEKLYFRDDIIKEVKSKIGFADGQIPSKKELAEYFGVAPAVLSRFLRTGARLDFFARKLGYEKVNAFYKKKTANDAEGEKK